MGLLKWVIAAAAGFGGLIALVYVMQRSLMYFPERLRTPSSAAGLPEAHEVTLDSKDGEKLIVWHVPPRGEKPVVLYFHGNGGGCATVLPAFVRSLRAAMDSSRSATAATAVQPDARPKPG